MNQVVSRRRRLARVRAIQLKAETIELAAAQSQLSKLEEHRSTIDVLATNSDPVAGAGIGGNFASTVELRQRLIAASHSLSNQLGLERATVAMHQSRCMSADRNKQIADRQAERAVRAAERAMDLRRAMPARRRSSYADMQSSDTASGNSSS